MTGSIQKSKNRQCVPFEKTIRLSILIKPKQIKSKLECHFIRIVRSYSYENFEIFPSINKSSVLCRYFIHYILFTNEGSWIGLLSLLLCVSTFFLKKKFKQILETNIILHFASIFFIFRDFVKFLRE